MEKERNALELYQMGNDCVPIQFVRSHFSKASNYTLTMRPDGRIRVSLPSDGNESIARLFIAQNHRWIHQQRKSVAKARRIDEDWDDGTRIMYFGDWVTLRRLKSEPAILLGDLKIPSESTRVGLKAQTLDYLQNQAKAYLPKRIEELSYKNALPFNRVFIKNQQRRWGTCSKRKNISLNWRLIQCPDWVRDYVILHELQHTKYMNHSLRYWRSLKQLCDHVRQAEDWLKSHSFILLSNYQ